MPESQSTEKIIRCVSCGKVIAKGYITIGAIEIRCKCGVMNRIQADKEPEGQDDPIKHLGLQLGTRVLANRIRR